MLKKWDDKAYDHMASSILDAFSSWSQNNLDLSVPIGNVQDYYGFVYTDTSNYAGLWCCNKECHYLWMPNLTLSCLAYDEDMTMFVVFENEWQEEVRIPIGSLSREDIELLPPMSIFTE